MEKYQISYNDESFTHRLKEVMAFAGFAGLVFLCLMIIGIAFVGEGLLACRTAPEIIRYMLPRIPFIAFYSWFFSSILQMIWDTRRYPYTELVLAADAVIAGVGLMIWTLYHLWI